MDKNKIILMSKLAIEEKQSLNKDKKITSYFSEDYIYVNNFKTRLLVFIMTGIIMFLYIFAKLQIGGTLPTNLEEVVGQYIIPYGGSMIAIILAYSVISSQIYQKKYNLAQSRINSYKKNLKALEELEKSRDKGDERNEAK
ncbi:hypothetical protein PBV87_00590 [Niameybacter massiliensis]|uniref:Uncharacterized protein n=1 Tax=Holtiella tumoricola TaxID=3018743 RepID=A0AA42DJC1_9FIRM|nr:MULTISPECIES: hypothetical protein [Lachnospirales]MDA3730011.1 hypothetical protein [Holtiella tumoricola]